MNEDEIVGMSDAGMGAGAGMPPQGAPAGDGDPAEEFANVVIEAIRPVIVDVVNQLMAAGAQ